MSVQIKDLGTTKSGQADIDTSMKTPEGSKSGWEVTEEDKILKRGQENNFDDYLESEKTVNKEKDEIEKKLKKGGFYDKAHEEGLASISGAPDSMRVMGKKTHVNPDGKHIDENLTDEDLTSDELGEVGALAHLNENYIQDQFGVLYRPVYIGEAFTPKDDTLIFENKYYITEGLGNCEFCQGAGKITVEKLGLKDCPDCDGTGDVQSTPAGIQNPPAGIQNPISAPMPVTGAPDGQDESPLENAPDKFGNEPTKTPQPNEESEEKPDLTKKGKRPDKDIFGEAKNDEGDWITVSGNHILVKKGQSKKQAIQDFLDSKNDDLDQDADWKPEQDSVDQYNADGAGGNPEYDDLDLSDNKYPSTTNYPDKNKADQINKGRFKIDNSEPKKGDWDNIEKGEISDDTKKFSYKFVRSKHNDKGLTAKQVQIRNTQYDKLKNMDNEIWDELNFSSGKDVYSRDGMSKYKDAIANKLGGRYNSIDKETDEWLTNDNYHSMNLAIKELKAGIKDGEIENWWDNASKKSREELMDYSDKRYSSKYDDLDSMSQSVMRLRFVNRHTGQESVANEDVWDDLMEKKSKKLKKDFGDFAVEEKDYGNESDVCPEGQFFDSVKRECVKVGEPTPTLYPLDWYKRSEEGKKVFSNAVEACGCKVKAMESIKQYEGYINSQLNVLKRRARAGESVGMLYGLPTVQREGKKIKGTLAYAGVSLNDRIYLPETLAKGHGRTLPLLLNHSSTAGAEEELHRLTPEMLEYLENDRDYQVGEVTLTWDPEKLTLFYEGTVENEFFQREIDEMDMAVSLGIYYDSDSPTVCDESCYTLIKGAEFREVSLVYHAGFPIATIEAVEAKLKAKARKAQEKNWTVEGEPEQIEELKKGLEPAEEIEDPLSRGGSIDVEEKPEGESPIINLDETEGATISLEALTTTHDFSIRGVTGMTISNTNGVERYMLDPTQSYSTNTLHFNVGREGAEIFGEQLQPKMTTTPDITKILEAKPDIKFTDADEDILKKN